MKRETFDVFVCVDCGLQLANGEVENPDPHWQGFDHDNRWDGYIVVNWDSDKDHDFSWSHCEGCGSTLGGTRMHCVAWEVEYVR
jgi:hypothetical protein